MNDHKWAVVDQNYASQFNNSQIVLWFSCVSKCVCVLQMKTNFNLESVLYDMHVSFSFRG